ncbi:MAG: type II secretion system protein GspI [Gammaproteobacteria bacterium]|nr:type II secretion system protein GspI [Gammaproteobacteria bacterium]
MPRAERGFTLIEVLAALVIVALGMLGVIEAVTQSARNGTYLRDRTLAHWIAMNVVTERRLQPDTPAVGETSDEVEFASVRWKWTMRVTQTQVQSLRRMDVSVRPADAPESTALATVTGFYGTAVGAAGGGVLDWSGTQTGGTGQTDGESTDTGKGKGKGQGTGSGTGTGDGQPTSPVTTPTPPPNKLPTDDEQ